MRAIFIGKLASEGQKPTDMPPHTESHEKELNMKTYILVLVLMETIVLLKVEQSGVVGGSHVIFTIYKLPSRPRTNPRANWEHPKIRRPFNFTK